MKTILNYFLGMFAILSLSSCGNAKKAQENARVHFGTAYFTSESAEASSGKSTIKFHLPTSISREDSVMELDSVVFRGKKAQLYESSEQEGLYIATLETTGKPRDFVMSSDPNEEYGNRVPEIIEKSYGLEPDEAILIYRLDGEPMRQKIKGITKRDVAPAK